MIKLFPVCLWHKYSNEHCHQATDGAEVKEQSRSAQHVEDHVRGLDCNEDHEEAVGDQRGADKGLQIRREPFS